MGEGKIKAYVLPVTGREAVIVKLKQLVVAMGGALVCDDKGTLEGFDACVEAADVIVVLICEETTNSPTVKRIIEMASRLGKRIIGVWLDEAVSDTVPAILDSQGDAVIGMNGEDIKQAVIDGERVWKVPSGKKRPDQKTPRHKGH
jgi:hypothetical protein